MRTDAEHLSFGLVLMVDRFEIKCVAMPDRTHL